MTDIDPEEYGSFKGKVKVQIEFLLNSHKDLKKLIEKKHSELAKLIEALGKFVKEHMENEEKDRRADLEEMRALNAKVMDFSDFQSTNEPLLKFLKTIKEWLDWLTFKRVMTWGSLITLSFILVFGIIVPLLQNWLVEHNIDPKFLNFFTYDPWLNLFQG